MLASGGARACLQDFRRMDGNPSGPAAELLESSFIADDMSSSEKHMLWIDSCAGSSGNNSFGLSWGCFGMLNTERYCSESSSDICLADVRSVLAELIRGPIPILIF